MNINNREHIERMLKQTNIQAYQLASRKNNVTVGNKMGIAASHRRISSGIGMPDLLGRIIPVARRRNQLGTFAAADQYGMLKKNAKRQTTTSNFHSGNINELVTDAYAFDSKNSVRAGVQNPGAEPIVNNLAGYSVASSVSKQIMRLHQMVSDQLFLGSIKDSLPKNYAAGEYRYSALGELVNRRNTGKDKKGLSELNINLSSGRLGHEQWRSGEGSLGMKIAYTLVPNEEMHRFMKFIDGAPKTQVDQLTPPGNLKANWSRLSELKNKDVIGTKDDDSAKAVKHLSDAGSIKEVVAGFLKNVVKYDNTKSPFQKFEFLRNVRSEYYIPGNHFANGLPPADSFLSTAAGKWKNRTNTMYQLSGMKVLDGADPNLYPTRTWEQTSRFPGRFKAAVSTNVFNPLREQTLPNQAHLSHNRTVHIHMNRPLIERFSITTKDTGGGITEFKRKVEEVLLEILNSANATR